MNETGGILISSLSPLGGRAKPASAHVQPALDQQVEIVGIGSFQAAFVTPEDVAAVIDQDKRGEGADGKLALHGALHAAAEELAIGDLLALAGGGDAGGLFLRGAAVLVGDAHYFQAGRSVTRLQVA